MLIKTKKRVHCREISRGDKEARSAKSLENGNAPQASFFFLESGLSVQKKYSTVGLKKSLSI